MSGVAEDPVQGEARRAMGWAEIAEDLRRRITLRVWAPGEMIPHEEALAREFGVSRMTVHRALRQLAEAGLIDRRRKAGTRVSERPVRRAVLEVPVIRDEVERLGRRYRYECLDVARMEPPEDVHAALGLRQRPPVLRVLARHSASGRPYAFEERWINGGTVPEALEVDWRETSPNEWLLNNVAYTRVEMAIGATEAFDPAAGALGCVRGEAVLRSERVTWAGQWSVTLVRFLYPPGFVLRPLI